ncbi:unnamed protein product [Cylicocyclus nassatus]|uniref:Uncharacterized protein n=1 Tax=Cylicocyclus nassatus TaxID=53992 RepID=A0AA36GKD4_CYLNA|nr:unnamed protein product [Cylicocyclus nassatus]
MSFPSAVSIRRPETEEDLLDVELDYEEDKPVTEVLPAPQILAAHTVHGIQTLKVRKCNGGYYCVACKDGKPYWNNIPAAFGEQCGFDRNHVFYNKSLECELDKHVSVWHHGDYGDAYVVWMDFFTRQWGTKKNDQSAVAKELIWHYTGLVWTNFGLHRWHLCNHLKSTHKHIFCKEYTLWVDVFRGYQTRLYCLLRKPKSGK